MGCVDMQTFEILLKDLEFISNRISEECGDKEVAISVVTSLFLQSSIRQAITENCEGCLNGSDNQIKHMMGRWVHGIMGGLCRFLHSC